jgi:ferredoxin, 2Fe-2S
MRRPKTSRPGNAASTSAGIEVATTITVHLQDADGTPHPISGRVGRSLMQAAVDAGIDGIAADCGGSLTCATCHVIVDAAWLAQLPPRSGDEDAMLEMTAHPRQPGSRLSCQIRLSDELDGLAAQLPPTQY